MTSPWFNAVIPSIGLSPLLPALVDTLIADGARMIWMPDNSEDGDAGPWAKYAAHLYKPAVVIRTDDTIYESWNRAMDRARLPLAVLNDDIILAPGSIAEAARHLCDRYPVVGLNYREPTVGVHRADAVEVSGTFKDGGVGGFAFVVDPFTCPRVDPRFRWWYGDDDLMNQVRRSGRSCAIALGAPVAHPHPSTSGNQMPWLNEACDADRALYASLWP